jgi:hypothetical protein
MSTSKTLGNAEPTDAERQRMIVVLDGLRERLFNARGSRFHPAAFNEDDGTVELRHVDGGRALISAWIHGEGSSRALLVWRHPTYRYEQDDAYLHAAKVTK